jgi:hypothetical protein
VSATPKRSVLNLISRFAIYLMIKVNIHYNAHLRAFTYVMHFWPQDYTISPRTPHLDTLLRYHAERIPDPRCYITKSIPQHVYHPHGRLLDFPWTMLIVTELQCFAFGLLITCLYLPRSYRSRVRIQTYLRVPHSSHIHPRCDPSHMHTPALCVL